MRAVDIHGYAALVRSITTALIDFFSVVSFLYVIHARSRCAF